jgi:hypothetical protein
MSRRQYIEPALPGLCRFVPDRVIRRRPIRVIAAGSPGARPRAASLVRCLVVGTVALTFIKCAPPGWTSQRGPR